MISENLSMCCVEHVHIKTWCGIVVLAVYWVWGSQCAPVFIKTYGSRADEQTRSLVYPTLLSIPP